MSDQLPYELVTEILSRLPAKSTGRFRCVSKEWYRLLTHPSFIDKHLNLSKQCNNRLKLLVTTRFEESFSLYSIVYDQIETCGGKLVEKRMGHPIPLSFETTSFWVIGSCDGILCLIFPLVKIICLWNPCTGESKKLHTSSKWGSDAYGFAHNPAVNDYQVVRFGYDRFVHETSVYIYSLAKGTYRQIDDIPYFSVRPRNAGVFVNGALHWFGSRKDANSTMELLNGQVLVAYDIEGEQCREIPMPAYKEHMYETTVAEFEGQLCVTCFCGGRVDVWMMKEYSVNGSWTKFFTRSGPHLNYYVPVCYTGNGCLLFLKWLGLALYDPKTRNTPELKIQVSTKTASSRKKNSGLKEKVIAARIYSESLVRLS